MSSSSVMMRIFGRCRLVLALLCVCLLSVMTACGGGDDDGLRLGEHIVGTWQRGWGEGDVVIEGSLEISPDIIPYDQFVFNADGTYNGMMRSGTFYVMDKEGNRVLEGDYRCDNNNIRMESLDAEGRKLTILAQVLSFTETTLLMQYDNQEYGVAVTFTLRKYREQ